MNENLKQIKESLKLTRLESDFFDFCALSLGFNQDTPIEQVKLRIQPWFSLEFNPDKTYTQVYSEYVQQKYRIALDFCAQHAGFNSVEYQHVGDETVAVSNGLFWFRDTHPEPVKWIMVHNARVIAYGEEDPYSITIAKLEDWLLINIKYLSDMKKAKDIELRHTIS